MYPNISLINAVNLFFKIYSIISVENKHYFCLEIHFVNFNLAPDCRSLYRVKNKTTSNWRPVL